MLTGIQQKLLQMTKEIDGICLRNGIHYTLGGGTAIGAIRHRGFLPWDDDIDLYMTRDNWEKFKAACAAGDIPANRVIESAETDERYTNSMGRYVSTDSSSVHSHQIIGSDPAGHVIDIFVFDRLHYDNYRRYLEDLMLFSDIMDESKSYSSRLDMNLKRYPEALRRCKAEGKKAVTDELISSFTGMDAPGSAHYIMEWGTAPFLFPEDIFDDGYVRVPFEDTSLEIMRNYTEYLIWQYGCEWEYIPDHSGREGHEAIFSSTIPYDKVREDYMPFIDADRLHRAYIRRKKRLLKANPHRRAAENAARSREAETCARRLHERLDSQGLGIEELGRMLSGRRYDELSDIFGEYIDLQLGPRFAGRRDKHSTLRAYMYPQKIDVGEDLAVIAARLLMQTERMSKARRLIDIYTGDFPENLSGSSGRSVALGRIKQELIRTAELMNAADACEDKDAVSRELEEACRDYPENTRLLRLRLAMLLKGSRTDGSEKEARSILERLFELIPEYSPAYGELRKYRADLEGAGSSEYRDIYRSTNNGCVKLAIADLLKERGEPVPEDTDAQSGAEAAAAPAVGPDTARRSSLSPYSLARGLYRRIARRDDRIKERAWEIACRTMDRVYLLEEYRDRIPRLEEMLDSGDWEGLSAGMKDHEEAVLRNYSLGLGLCVHPALSRLQYELFRHDGRAELAEKIDKLVPEQHRKPIA